MPRLLTVVRYVAGLAAVVLLVSIATFSLLELLPGDPAYAILGDRATEEQVAIVRDQLGLDRPAPVRYVEWLGGVVQGDLGESVRTGQDVTDAIMQRLPISLELMIAAQLVSVPLGILLGVTSARRPDRFFDRAMMAIGDVMVSLPHFVLGLILILFFSVKFGWLPATGFTRITEDPVGNLRTLVLPVITLAFREVAVVHRLVRADLLETLQQDYIAAASAKGLSPRYVLWRHALRPSSFSVLTHAGMNVGRLMGGAVIVESMFAIPGLGQMLVSSIFTRDYIMMQGAVLVVCLIYIIASTTVDLLYRWLDPRMRA